MYILDYPLNNQGRTTMSTNLRTILGQTHGRELGCKMECRSFHPHLLFIPTQNTPKLQPQTQKNTEP